MTTAHGTYGSTTDCLGRLLILGDALGEYEHGRRASFTEDQMVELYTEIISAMQGLSSSLRSLGVV